MRAQNYDEDLAVEIESRVNEVEGKKGIRAALKKVCEGLSRRRRE